MVDAVLFENKQKPLTLLQVETASFLSQGKSETSAGEGSPPCWWKPFTEAAQELFAVAFHVSCWLLHPKGSPWWCVGLLVWAAFCSPVLRSVSAHTCFRRKIKSLSYIHASLSPPTSRAHWHNWHTQWMDKLLVGKCTAFPWATLDPFLSTDETSQPTRRNSDSSAYLKSLRNWRLELIWL